MFITTSDFSKEARDFAQQIDSKIVLLNGKLLTALMIEHDLGVSQKQIFKVKIIDTDYFDALDN